MKGKKIKLLMGIAISFLISVPIINSFSASHYKPPPNDIVADLLGWIPTPATPCLPCGGYFYEPKDIQEHPTPAPYESLPTKITAKGPTIFSKTGASILQKDVHVTQTGRSTKADKAYIYRDRNTGKISMVKLHGHVKMQEHDKLLASENAWLNLKDGSAQLDNVAYKVTQDFNRMGINDSWGTAKKASRSADNLIVLKNGTYSTCSPLHPTWQISAKKITINKKKKRAKAKSAVFKLRGLPIFYFPYVSFSMDNDRKSGFLSPIIENSSKNGFTFGLPYYWNMAPNYDMLITPTYYTKRKFQFSTLFRYLSESSVGKFYLSYLPNDKQFQKFRNDTISEFPTPENTPYAPYINALKSASDYRGYFAYYNESHFNDKWTLNAQFNYVTDPYYLRDLGATINDVVANQLLNQVDLDYQGTHWNFTLLAQAFQTLHLIDEIYTPTVNQYMRLPELDTSADYPNIFSGVDFNLSMQAVNFDYDSLFPPKTNTLPIGQRLHLRPTFTRPFIWAAGYFTPGISVDSTSYNVDRIQPGQASTSTRNLPIVDLDTGLYLDRHFNFHQHDFIQTLEPRLFYLYVPFENQDRFPVYDSQILPFTYEQLFAVNRFTGFDRLQNANQTSFGLTTRILDGDDAHELLKADIGVGYLIDQPKVCLSPGCMQENEHWTPIATDLIYYPTPQWAIRGDFAWDAELSRTNNAQLNISYTRDGKHVIGAGYTYVSKQPSSPNFSSVGYNINSALYSVYFAWPLFSHWSTLGYLYYNSTEGRPENYFVGLQYDTCCIAFRVIFDRTFQGVQPLSSGTQSVSQYNNTFIFQIQLKGLGTTGNQNPYAMLESGIPGYRDPFKY